MIDDGAMSDEAFEGLGREMHGWARTLFPLHRSLTGPGVRATLRYLQRLLPGLTVHAVLSGTQAFDWTVPDEWTLREAYVEDESGRRWVDVADHTLHVVGYAEPVDRWLTREALQPHLHSLPEQPDAVPYVTSYYERRWGFCLAHRVREAMPPGRYRAVIDSTLAPGHLHYGELVLPGERSEEILLSTYVCHPSMANNELSGPVVTAALARLLAERPRRFTYRILFLPETIGAIVYLSRHLEALRRQVYAGFVVTCIGDERAYSHVASRRGDTPADRAARHVLSHLDPDYRAYSFLDRGSDERQYGSPGVDLPVAVLCRSKFGAYPEYHTSLDDLELVTPAGLAGGLRALLGCVEVFERDRIPRMAFPCEPQLGRRGLYPTLSTATSTHAVRALRDLVAYADGTRSLLEIADVIGVPFGRLDVLCARLEAEGVVSARPV